MNYNFRIYPIVNCSKHRPLPFPTYIFRYLYHRISTPVPNPKLMASPSNTIPNDLQAMPSALNFDLVAKCTVFFLLCPFPLSNPSQLMLPDFVGDKGSCRNPETSPWHCSDTTLHACRYAGKSKRVNSRAVGDTGVWALSE